jgi:hypothetical protein
LPDGRKCNIDLLPHESGKTLFQAITTVLVVTNIVWD